jgi:hypothetical protein
MLVEKGSIPKCSFDRNPDRHGDDAQKITASAWKGNLARWAKISSIAYNCDGINK